jgi:hypothetical protein
MRGELSIQRARLLAAIRSIDAAIVTARLDREDGAAAGISGLDRLRKDINAALDLLEDRPDRMMSLGASLAQTRLDVASACNRG